MSDIRRPAHGKKATKIVAKFRQKSMDLFDFVQFILAPQIKFQFSCLVMAKKLFLFFFHRKVILWMNSKICICTCISQLREIRTKCARAFSKKVVFFLHIFFIPNITTWTWIFIRRLLKQICAKNHDKAIKHSIAIASSQQLSFGSSHHRFYIYVEFRLQHTRVLYLGVQS